jgi:hypothetical protein
MSAQAIRRLNHGGLTVFILLVIGGLLFVLFPARILECDAVMFSYGALHGDIIFLGYAHHLGYNYLQLAASQLTPLFDPPLSPIYILQYLSMAAGLAGIYLLYRLLLTLGVGVNRAFLFSGALMLAYGYWHYSQQADVHVISAAILIWFAYVCYGFLEHPSVSRAAGLGAILGLATFIHQTNTLMLPAVFLACILRARQGAKTLRPLMAFAVVYFLIGILPYPLIARYLVGVKTLTGLRLWLTSTNEWGGWGAWRLAALPATAIGLIRTFTGSHYLLGLGPFARLAHRVFPSASLQDEMAVAEWGPTWLRMTLMPIQAIILLFTAKALVGGAGRLRHLVRLKPAFAVFVITWLVILGVFFAWWAPERVDFWIAWLPGVIIVLAYPGKKRTGRQTVSAVTSVAFLAGLFTVNFFGSIYPQSGPISERDTEAAVNIDAVVDTGDIVISDCYFAGRASQFSDSFRRLNPLGGVLPRPKVGMGTIYAYRDGRSLEAGFDVAALDSALLTGLEARVISRVDSVVGMAMKEGRSVYILASPISTNPDRMRIYNALVRAIGEHYDLSERVRIRGDLDMRRIKAAELRG